MFSIRIAGRRERVLKVFLQATSGVNKVSWASFARFEPLRDSRRFARALAVAVIITASGSTRAYTGAVV